MVTARSLINILHILFVGTIAQFPPTPEGVTTIETRDHDGASLSYKQTYICETTPGVKGYSGYVNLPSTLTGEDFNISTFYWYFESRKDPENAPLSIYLAGGAAESSMDGATGEGGPCTINTDSNSTTLNPWSFNNEVNMLYIDQPVQTGFSYDTLVNGTLDLIQNVITPRNFSDNFVVNDTTLWGTFPSQNPSSITAGSERGANALWHFMQVWTINFPEYHVKNKKISFWGNSWAGFYVPTTFAFFAKQNERILQNKNSPGPKPERVLPLDVMGITNGCIDPLIEALHYPEMATNNTYGFQAYNNSVYESALDAFSVKGGCKDLINQCREIAAEGDPAYNGNNETVNTACGNAFFDCFENVQAPYMLSGRSAFDMSHQILDPFPYYRQGGYFNQRWVQAALGVPVNFTDIGAPGANLYSSIGDAIRGNISNLEYVLEGGYKVAMVFGDRDYRCNWLGGEAISLAADWPYAADFKSSGYAPITTNTSYTGGYVRQAGKLSFSRVFQAGHAVQAYQPETVSRIFTRSMFGLDVATGTQAYESFGDCLYNTTGPLAVRSVTEALPPMPETMCYIWQAGSMCTDNQLSSLENGTAIIEDYYVVNPQPEESD